MVTDRRTTIPRVGAPQQPPWLRPPGDWAGSLPEWAIFWALLQEFGPDSEGVVWFYQTPFAGGRLFAGGAVIDFWLPDYDLGIRVQGIYFHYRDGDTRARDIIQKAQLEGSGIRVVDIDEDQALRSPREALRNALAGIDRSRGART